MVKADDSDGYKVAARRDGRTPRVTGRPLRNAFILARPQRMDTVIRHRMKARDYLCTQIACCLLLAITRPTRVCSKTFTNAEQASVYIRENPM